MKAIWNGHVVAESDATIEVEGNHYFPHHALITAYFEPSRTHTRCSWKGTANYYNLVVAGKINRDAAWYYAVPSDAARHIANYVAFWKGVEIVDENAPKRHPLELPHVQEREAAHSLA